MIPAITAVRSLVGSMTFEETFSPAIVGPHQDFVAAYPRWTPHYYFGDPNGLSSRSFPGPLNIMLDGGFDPSSVNVQAPNGCLYLFAAPLTPDQAARYPGFAYSSGVVTTQKSFAQAFGYFEISAKLPTIPGLRSSFWLLPTAVTPTNGGRLSEHDVFECESGPLTVMSNGNPLIIDRSNQPYSTIHYGVTGNEQKITNTSSLPPKLAAGFHTYGYLWTPDTLSVYIDQAVVLTAPNPGIVDPHYIVLSLDVMGNQNPDPKQFPAAFIVDYVRAWALP